MGLIDRMIMKKIDKLGKKLLKLNTKLESLEEECHDVKEVMQDYDLHLSIVEKYYAFKLESTKRKIDRTEKSLVKTYDKLYEKSFGGILGLPGLYPDCYDEQDNNL